jgi:PHP family Zn ribbon phosphoesterase
LHIIPLAEIIAVALGQSSPFTKRVTEEWLTLIKSFGSEVKVSVDASIEDIARVAAPVVVKAIQAFREDKVLIHPGGGGEYGRIELTNQVEVEAKPEERQKSIFDYVI